MKTSTTPRYWKAYSNLSSQVQAASRKQYRLWNENPSHPSLRFKKVGPFWSIRVSDHYRALSVLKEGVYYWFWIGTHAEYERILKGK